ncbi:hypothetical protein T07_7844 [Trichinella nelsoni]|uniref:Uncharacterized protein n=1 Tax=Trichinella nelsoni TaxID=6336 RepID=A0A0V0SIS7_9BILA|nr:hypothetical protein T07_7844 [Trichinella nelsoni]
MGHCEWALEGLAGGGIRSSKMFIHLPVDVSTVKVKCPNCSSSESFLIIIAAELFWSLFRSGPVVHHAHQFDLNEALQTLISIAFAADCSSVQSAHLVEGDVVTSFSGPSLVSSIIRPVPMPTRVHLDIMDT